MTNRSGESDGDKILLYLNDIMPGIRRRIVNIMGENWYVNHKWKPVFEIDIQELRERKKKMEIKENV